MRVAIGSALLMGGLVAVHPGLALALIGAAVLFYDYMEYSEEKAAEDAERERLSSPL